MPSCSADYEMLLALDEGNHQHTGASANLINSLPQSTILVIHQCLVKLVIHFQDEPLTLVSFLPQPFMFCCLSLNFSFGAGSPVTGESRKYGLCVIGTNFYSMLIYVFIHLLQTDNFTDACAICLEIPVQGETIRHLPCLHKFHKDVRPLNEYICFFYAKIVKC